MKSKYLLTKLSTLLLLCVMAVCGMSCDNEMAPSSLNLKGDARILSFSIDGKSGHINDTLQTIQVYLNPGTDVSSLQPVYTLSEGASCSIASGETVNFTTPVTYSISNGNAYMDYKVTATCFEAKILSFTLTDGTSTYQGQIDETQKVIQVYTPSSANIKRMTVDYTLSDSAEATPAKGMPYDFSQPLQFTVTNHGATATYTVKVTNSDMPVTAFIGTAATVDGLKDEEKAAANWMLANVPRSVYISMQDLINGKATLDPATVKAVWWHGDRNDWPSEAWDSREAIKNYYAQGGNLLLSRWACRYVNDVYQIAKDQKEPNKQFPTPSPSLSAPLGFDIYDNSHPIFKDMTADNGHTLYLIDQGVSVTNQRVDWNAFDNPYQGWENWENATGGKRLAVESDDYGNQTAIVEFPARTKSAGKVILVGAGAYEWNVADNRYTTHRNQLTLNILYYLTGLTK